MLAKSVGKVDMLAFTVWSSLAAPLPLFALSLAVEGTGGLAALAHPGWKLAVCVLVLSYGGTLFGYGLWARLLAHHSAATVAPFALLVPVVGMIAAALLFGEGLSPVEVVGGALVMAGLALNVFGGWALRRRLPANTSEAARRPVELFAGVLVMAGFAPKIADEQTMRRSAFAEVGSCTISERSARIRKLLTMALRRRGLAPRAESLIALDEKRRAAIAALQRAQERRNAASKQIGVAMARKDTVAAEDFRAEVAAAKAKMPELEAAEREAATALETELAAIPNLPADDTPDGKDESDNVELRRWGAPPSFRRHEQAEASISRSARRWASWISRPPRNCRARGSSC